jgi:methionine aminopeptidase
MRASCKLAAQVLQHAGSLVRPGVTTDEIDAAVHAMVIAAGAYPSPLNYGKFPKSVCTSVNECLCHGIPDSRWASVAQRQQRWRCGRRRRGGAAAASMRRRRSSREGACATSRQRLGASESLLEPNVLLTRHLRPAHPATIWRRITRPLKDGDIINIDVTVYLNGYHGDTSAMFYVGTPSPTAKRLCEATREALEAAIKARWGGAGSCCRLLLARHRAKWWGLAPSRRAAVRAQG